MKWDDFLEQDPGEAHTARVMLAADAELGKLKPRRRFLAWLVPATLAVGGIVALKWRRDEHEMSGELLFVLEAEEEAEVADALELLEELDWIEDLEVLEEWTT